ncbi:hypothetical protein ES677_14915 [Bizionia gelidisalsuginis]|uniref:Lipoprotein n=1 Tax=Bizionia gelidisalsuginis TaxID=291188 RepID=A0ABY3M6U9_9FLAO|nr:hypothetical protein [Bizionia gelidisalsuginis]TYC07789.1 hypothetical protein ES677_14915 [Bizionia gelidisalsuginis]
MMNIQPRMIYKCFILLFFTLVFGCKEKQNSLSVYNDTFDSFLTKSVIDIRYNTPPSFEEYKDGLSKKAVLIRPDSISKLKLFVVQTSSDNYLLSYKNYLPKDYKNIIKNSSTEISYVPEKTTVFSNHNFAVKIIEEKDIKSFKRSEEFSGNNVGGILYFSKMIINKEHNKAMVYVSWFKEKLNGSSSIILFKREKENWVINEVVAISVS